MGRKGKYETFIKPYLDQISDWILTMNEDMICEKLGISKSSFQNYKREHPELVEAISHGREILVKELRDTLKMKAKGYWYTETKVKTRITDEGEEITYREEYKKYAHPDTGAIHLLLKNFDETWHNDDKQTMQIKREELDLKRQKMEEGEWS